VTTVLSNFLALSVLLYNVHATGFGHNLLRVAYLVFVLSLSQRAYRLKRRVAALVTAAANRCGLTRVTGKKSKPMPEGN